MNKSMAGAVAFALDRNAPEMIEAARKLGGGWRTGIQIWQAMGDAAPYLLMAATTPKRVKQRAPLVMVARDLDVLRASAQMICDELSDVQCLWVISPALKEVIGDIALADAAAAGGVQ